VEVRKNIVLKIDFSQSSSSSHDIHLDFIPDDMKVKYSQYIYNGRFNKKIIDAYDPVQVDFTGVAENWPIPQYVDEDDQEPELSLVYCDLVNDYIATVIDNGKLQTYNTIWTIGKHVKNTYKFTITGEDDELDENRDGRLIIHLEFIKYKQNI